MAAEDEERWDARYAGRSDDVVPAPPDVLTEAEVIDSVPSSGRALDVACGRGAQTVWMAKRGLEVTAIDVSGEAIRQAREAANRHDVSDRVKAMVVDLDAGLPADLGEFDLVVCQRFRAPHLYEPLIEHLGRGGWLVMTVLSETGAIDPGEFHAPPGELTLFFDRPGCVLIAHHEADGQESIVIERSR